MKRVFVFSQCPLLAQGIATLLQRENGITIVGVESKPDEVLGHIIRVGPDAIIVDSGQKRNDPSSITDLVLRAGLGSSVVELDSLDNNLYICSREHRVVRDVCDLLNALEGLSTLEGAVCIRSQAPKLSDHSM